MMKKFIILGSISLALFAQLADADEFTSSSFKVRDPVLQIASSTEMQSTNFRLIGTVGQIAIGTSTAASFGVRGGFLYFPKVTSPVVSATPGDAKVSLSWTASQGFLGWNVSGYNVGRSTSSGGPYTFTSSLGNVLTHTVTGLTNGTTYFFIVRAEDAFGNSIATSSEVSATPVATSPPPPPPPSGGGGIFAAPETKVIFSGRAYPKSVVTLLKDAQIAATTIAGADANFSITLTGLSAGNYIFSIYSEDGKGIRSSLLTFPVSVTSGATTNVGGIFIAPTIAVDKSEVKRGDNIAIFGQSAPQADIVISVTSEEEFFGKTISDKDGIYIFNFDTSFVDYGTHHAKSKASIGNQAVSNFSNVVSFKVGTKNVLASLPQKCPAKADLNSDCRVNLVDFSIAAYWYKRPISAEFSRKEKTLLSGDGKVDLVDFSIMAYYWTG
jgi:hypothetical protein